MDVSYECAIVGGGIAGLQAAIQLGRYKRKVIVIDAGDGRSVQCRNYNNLLGWDEGVSGAELRQKGRRQAEQTGVKFIEGKVTAAYKPHQSMPHKSKSYESQKVAELFQLELADGRTVFAKRLLLSTGVVDRLPNLRGLLACLGKSIFVCPDCDGYEIVNEKAVVLGSGNTGAQMALTVAYWSQDIVFINHEHAPVDSLLMEQLRTAGIEQRNDAVDYLIEQDGSLSEVKFKDGSSIYVNKGFVAFGNNEVRSELALQLGVELHKNKHVIVNPRTKMTTVEYVWCAGDVVAHSEQVAIAMGDGVQAAIWIHKSLLEAE